ncbi:hypothetical protein BV22DRAFT_1120625 [Leucogyrophana mollusca]|uniref:Uncharacterized protein n=1 Tax=Leucogyrophana mollusca TaxID=85980 RepID=A0ACB8BEG9_9AGAM|nr:hypothetical protein BV22DRAFT_1120625 [Leucogyrophana mollusca]
MSIIHPPTTHLPPIAKIASFTASQLLDALTYLRTLYLPAVRGSRRARIRPIPGHEADVDLLRSDAFERSYAIRWLTALIAQIELWGDLADADRLPSEGALAAPEPTAAHGEILIQQAASLLAICAGVAAAGKITRVFSFGSGRSTVEVQLTDIPLDNSDYGSVGAQTWGSACVLAEMIVERPETFGLISSGIPSDRTAPAAKARFRMLELGAGTGLVTLTVGKLMGAIPQWADRRAILVATDFHPSVLANLQTNIRSNFTEDSDKHQPSVLSHFLDWSQFPTMQTPPGIFAEPFDLVVGADIVYETQHAVWIKGCLETLLRRSRGPASGPSAFHLVIPLRPTHTAESNTIETVFSRSSDIDANAPVHAREELVILSKESIVCDAHDGTGREWSGRAEDVEYIYYEIGWRLKWFLEVFRGTLFIVVRMAGICQTAVNRRLDSR